MDRLKVYHITPGTVQEYHKEVSGRCHKCNARFIWSRRLGKLPAMTCPFCFAHLHETTHLFKGDTYRLEKE
jgi:hypothetical protein